MFSHGNVSAPPDLTKTSLCKLWTSGKCVLSSANCPFAHGKRELRQTPLFKSEKTVQAKKVSSPAMAPPCVNVPMPAKFLAIGEIPPIMEFHEIPAMAMEPEKMVRPTKSSNKMPLKPGYPLSAPTSAVFEPRKVEASLFSTGHDDEALPFYVATPPKFAAPFTPFPQADAWDAETGTPGTGASSSDDDHSHSSFMPDAQAQKEKTQEAQASSASFFAFPPFMPMATHF